MPDDPHDIEAERYVLASMMQTPAAIGEAAELLEPDQFYRPAHQVTFRAMVVMMAAGVRADPVTVRDWLTQDEDMRALGSDGALYLAGLMEVPANAQSVTHYARLVLAAARRRVILAETARIGAVVRQEITDPDEVLGRLDEWMEDVRRGGVAGRLHWGMDRKAVHERVSKLPPVVPGLIHAQDRVVVVATEGRGKTTLAHQVAFAVAAGIHPFQWQTRIEPQRVLIVDLENPDELLDRRFEYLATVAARYPGWSEDHLAYHLDVGGIDIGRASDAFAFNDLIRRHALALVVCGPIYKMIRPRDEGDSLSAHLRLSEFFDRMRSRHGCAIWLEAHAPIGSGGPNRIMRPEGSNIWSKWPEFGLALHKGTKAHGGESGVEIGRFRGHRDQTRQWPVALMRHGGGWPWQAVWGPHTLDVPLPGGVDEDTGEDTRS